MVLLELIIYIQQVIIVLLILLILRPFIKSFTKDYNKLKFRVYLLISYILFIIISFFLSLPIKYLFGVTLLFFTTLTYIMLIRKIKETKDKKERVSEWVFFWYLVSFALIIIGYISSFGIMYFKSYPISF